MFPIVLRLLCDEEQKNLNRKYRFFTESKMKKRRLMKKWTLGGQTVPLLLPAGLCIRFAFPLNFLCLSHRAPLRSIPS